MNTQSCTGSIKRMFNCGALSLSFSQLFALALLLTLVREGLGHIMCSVCDTDSGDTHCQDSPPPPTNCTVCKEEDTQGNCIRYPNPAMEYCMIVRKYDDRGTNSEYRTLLDFTRSCSAFHMRGESCFSGKDSERGIQVYMCHTTCEVDGCNSVRKMAPSSFWCSILVAASSCLFLQQLLLKRDAFV